MMRQDGGKGEDELSPRQRQILLLAAEGMTDRQIALEIGLGEGTVRTYWERIRGRLEARSRSEAIARSLSNEYKAAVEELNQMRALLSGLPQFVWTAEPTGEVNFVNDWFARYSGRSVTECVGFGCRALMPENEVVGSSVRWRNAQATGRGYSALVHFIDSEGIARLHQISLTPLRDPKGDIFRWVGSGFAVDSLPLR